MGLPWEAFLDVAYEEPCYVPGPDEAHFYMGAQVGWSPERESLPGTGTCPMCRGEIGGDYVCAKCLAWGRDDELAAKMVGDFGRRGTLQPEAVATIDGYRFPVRTRDLDGSGRPYWEPES